MNMTSKLDWTATFNIAAVCVSFSFICAIVVGVL
jgi:hypothetical protein